MDPLTRDESSSRSPHCSRSLLAIERREAQESIYALAYDVAVQGSLTPEEWKTLEWLAGVWQLPV